MSRVKVIALTTFEHNQTRRAGTMFEIDLDTAKKLADKGLVSFGDVEPGKKDEKQQGPQSSLQAAPASRKTTARKSKNGVKDQNQES